MAAFTHLCKKTNISIAHNTITVYKIKGYDFGFLYDPCDLDNPFAKRIAAVQPVYRHDREHHYFHHDSFDKENTHYHLKFTKNIDEYDLNEFLTILIEKKIVNEREKESCLEAFRQAAYGPLSQFYDELSCLQYKMFDLLAKAQKNPGKYLLATNAAMELYITLKKEMCIYQAKKNPETYDLFQKNCTLAIEKARLELKNHRGWKNLLGNLAAAVVGLGVFYLIAVSINFYQTQGRDLFFHFKTASEEILDKCVGAQGHILRV